MARSENWRRAIHEVYLGRSTSWGNYFGQYERVANYLLESVETGEHPINTICHPLLFLLRHSLELGYKANILELEKISGLPSQLQLRGRRAHKLDELHRDFERHFFKVVEIYGMDDAVLAEFHNYNSKLKELREIFQKLDEYSYSFRYPVDPDKEVNFEFTERLDVLAVKELYEEAMILLSHTIDVLGEYIEWH